MWNNDGLRNNKEVCYLIWFIMQFCKLFEIQSKYQYEKYKPISFIYVCAKIFAIIFSTYKLYENFSIQKAQPLAYLVQKVQRIIRRLLSTKLKPFIAIRPSVGPSVWRFAIYLPSHWQSDGCSQPPLPLHTAALLYYEIFFSIRFILLPLRFRKMINATLRCAVYRTQKRKIADATFQIN